MKGDEIQVNKDFKTKKKWPLILAISVYFAVCLVFHRRVNEFFDVFLQWMTYPQFNNYVFEIIVALAVITFALLVAVLRYNRHRVRWMLVLGVWITLAVLAHYLLFVSNIEAVHYPQYAILAIMIYALTGGETVSVVLATLLGAIDEANQYFILYAGRSDLYMDYNDIILNLLGAVFGIAAYLILFGEKSPDIKQSA